MHARLCGGGNLLKALGSAASYLADQLFNLSNDTNLPDTVETPDTLETVETVETVETPDTLETVETLHHLSVWATDTGNPFSGFQPKLQQVMLSLT